MRDIAIFDLDGTVIDSSHRQLSDPVTGSLDLDHWRENCTAEKIMSDSLLPLARIWWKAAVDGFYIMICTARVLQIHDYAFLAKHNLLADKIISRPEGNNLPDAKLKFNQLRSLFNLRQFGEAKKVMYDDNESVRRELSKLGITMVNPTHYNRTAFPIEVDFILGSIMKE